MKRLAAVALVVASFAWTAYAQHGAGHGGGFSGSHGGGFSGSHGGFFSHGGSSFHGGFSAPAGRLAGPPRYGINRSPQINRGFRPNTFAGRSPYADPMHRRMPYHSPYGRNNRFGFYSWGGLPLWSGWGYPYLPSYMDDYGDDGGQDGQNYAGAQPYPDYSSGPYQAPPDPNDSAPAYTPWPYGSPTPQTASHEIAPPPAEEPVTLVFKDGRPTEQIHNYMLTSTTLMVLDQHRRDIPIDQIDLPATARVNHDAGVDFALPNGTR
ncbi:MAG TPA: hypothetical protein VGG85_13500 [Terracidiphilus sp.]